jgi:hypothetical protein
MISLRRFTPLVPALALAVIAALLAAAPGHAIVPPKNCGSITVKHHRYNIKGDQLPCKQARSYAATYVGHHKTAHGYRCQRFSGSALVAKCVNTHTNPDRTIFIIKR